MLNTLLARESPSPPGNRDAVPAPEPDLLEWLRAGRLTLVGDDRQKVTLDQWSELPAGVRANALADFRRVARGRANAVVLFLRP